MPDLLKNEQALLMKSVVTPFGAFPVTATALRVDGSLLAKAQMSKEGDHHYVPQFHLRKWEGVDGKLMQWGRIGHNGKLICKSVATAGTGYVPGLYSLHGVNPKHVQQIETEVFGRIESKAKPVMDKLIEKGVTGLTINERYFWALYLNAAIIRVPHVVEKVKAGSEKLLAEELSRDIEEYNDVKGDAQEDSLFEWAKNHAPARLANSGLSVLVKLITDSKPIDRIVRLTWLVRDLSSSNKRLMLGDDPFERINELYKPRTLISIPLSPTHVFFGTDAHDVVERISRMTPSEIIRASNISTLTTAKKFAYGSAEPDFVDKYLLRSTKS
ncbi:DUF4238 domain-containing protein [Phyllobacterium sp. P5_D12]